MTSWQRKGRQTSPDLAKVNHFLFAEPAGQKTCSPQSRLRLKRHGQHPLEIEATIIVEPFTKHGEQAGRRQFNFPS
jgi:hypothetical protein